MRVVKGWSLEMSERNSTGRTLSKYPQMYRLLRIIIPFFRALYLASLLARGYLILHIDQSTEPIGIFFTRRHTWHTCGWIAGCLPRLGAAFCDWL